MIRKHKSSVATFFGIYLVVALIIGAAIYMLRRSHRQAAAKQSELLATSTDTVVSKTNPNPSLQAADQKEPESKPERETEPTLAPDPSPKTGPKQSPSPQPTTAADASDSAKPQGPGGHAALKAEIAKKIPIPKVKPLLEIVGNWQAVPKRAYPQFVTIRKPVDFSVRQNGRVVAQGVMPTGSSMIPIRLEGDRLFLSSSRLTNMSVSLPVSDTDFREKIEAKYNAFVENQKIETEARRQTELNRILAASSHETEMGEFNDGKDPRFDPLKASIRRGEAGFFQIESASKWRWSGMETHEGEQFQTAYVIMVQESVFGSTERELKALIKDGEVHSWIDMKTGEPL